MDQSASQPCLPTPLASTTGSRQIMRCLSKDLHPRRLLQFRYHPRSRRHRLDSRRRGELRELRATSAYTYTGPVYAEEEQRGHLSARCIADGSAAESLRCHVHRRHVGGARQFRGRDREVLCRTPGFTGWLQEELHHCGDTALGPGGRQRKVADLPDTRCAAQ